MPQQPNNENPIIESEQGTDPVSELGKLVLPKAPPPEPAHEPAPLPPQQAAQATADYIGQQQPGQLNQPMSADTLKALQDKLQPPELQALQSTDLPQYTGFHAASPDQSQTPLGQDTEPQPQMGGGLDLVNQAQQQLDALKREQLQKVTSFTSEASRNLNNSIIKGSSAVPLFDGNSFENVQNRINQTNRIIAKSAEQAKQDMANRMFQDPHMYPQVEQNPNKFRPDSMTNPFQNGDIGGFMHSLWGQVQAAGRGVSELNQGAVDTLHGAAGTIVDDKDPRYGQENDFAPFRGYRMWADSVYHNPWKLLTLPLAPIIASVEGHYGESGKGVLGGLQYIAGLGVNVMLGGATDLYNLATGHKSPPGQLPNVVQAFKGGNYDLLRQPDAKHPLSIFANTPAPDNLQDLKKRSILFSNPVTGWAIDRLGDMGVKKFPKPFGQQAADIGLKFVEGVAGLTGDLAVDPLSEIAHALNPKSYTAPMKAAQEAAKASLPEREIVGANLPVREMTELPPLTATVGGLKPMPPELQIAKMQAGIEARKPPTQVVQEIPPPTPKTPTQVVQEIPQHTPGTTVDPASLVEVKRTPDEITALAIHNGDAQPGRLHPLPDVRIRMLNEDPDGVYRTFGNPINQEDLRQNFPPHPAVADVPIPTSLREVFPHLQEAEKIANDPSRELALRYQAAHTADQLADRLALPPAVEDPKVMQELMPSLPASQYVSSKEGLALLKLRFQNELEYHASATNTKELADSLATQQQALTENLQRIDPTPDVGRQYLHQNPAQEPITAVDAPHPVTEPELTAFVREMDLMHGSKVRDLDLSESDPLEGSARHEMGVGHYLTTNWAEADGAARATINRNIPPLGTRQFDDLGTVHDVKVNAENTLDAAKPPTPQIKDVFIQEARNAKVPEEAIRAYIKSVQDTADMSLSRMFTEFDNKIATPQHNFPEEEALKFQRRIAARMKNMGIDSIAHVGEDGSVVVSVIDHDKIIHTLPEEEPGATGGNSLTEVRPPAPTSSSKGYVNPNPDVNDEITRLEKLIQEHKDAIEEGKKNLTGNALTAHIDMNESMIEDIQEELDGLRNATPSEDVSHTPEPQEPSKPPTPEPQPQLDAETAPKKFNHRDYDVAAIERSIGENTLAMDNARAAKELRAREAEPKPQEAPTPTAPTPEDRPHTIPDIVLDNIFKKSTELADSRYDGRGFTTGEVNQLTIFPRLSMATYAYRGDNIQKKLDALRWLLEYGRDNERFELSSQAFNFPIAQSRDLLLKGLVEQLTPEELRKDKGLLDMIRNIPEEKLPDPIKQFVDKAGFEWSKAGWRVPRVPKVPTQTEMLTPVEEAAHRYNTTQRTLGRLPDDPVVGIHAMEDGATLQARIVQQTAENYTSEAQKAVTDAQRVVNTESDLHKIAKADAQREIQRLADENAAKDATQSKHLNSPDDKWCG